MIFDGRWMPQRIFAHFILSLCLFILFLSPHAYADVKELYTEGIGYLDSEDYSKAIECFRIAIKENPNVPQLYNALGIAILRKNGSIQIAKRAFEKAIRLNPAYPDPYFNMGTFYAGTGHDAILATEQFEKAIQASPDFAKAYMGLGWIWMERKDAKKAVENFKKAIEIEPQMAEAQYGWGLASVALHDNATALKPITTLRSMGKFDMAQKIESMIQQQDQTKNDANPASLEGVPFGLGERGAAGK